MNDKRCATCGAPRGDHATLDLERCDAMTERRIDEREQLRAENARLKAKLERVTEAAEKCRRAYLFSDNTDEPYLVKQVLDAALDDEKDGEG